MVNHNPLCLLFFSLTNHIQYLAPRCIHFADDVLLLRESREELNERLEI